MPTSSVSVLRAIAIATVALSVACTGRLTDPAPGTPSPALTALPRSLTGSEQTLLGAANDFSFSLFRQLSATAQRDSNVFTSPLSVSMALGMTMNGAANATYTQMRSALGFGTAPDTAINGAYKSLIALLRGLDPTVDFRIANSIWYENGFPFNQSFLNTATTWFDAQVTGLDFGSAAAVPTINNWVNTSTVGKIPKIIDQIDPGQVMFLINAIYFKRTWRQRFDVAQTTDSPFHGVDGDQQMKLMHRNDKIDYATTTTFDAVDLPYGNNAFTMTVVLPHAGTSVETVAASLQGSTWSSLTSQFHTALVDLYLPKFTLTWERLLNSNLDALGMHDAFVPDGADFTRMSPDGLHLFINAVKQKTFVDINEDGTEAAAVTSVGIIATSAPVSVQMRVDRPFIFVIRERLSGTVIFMGKIVQLP